MHYKKVLLHVHLHIRFVQTSVNYKEMKPKSNNPMRKCSTAHITKYSAQDTIYNDFIERIPFAFLPISENDAGPLAIFN